MMEKDQSKSKIKTSIKCMNMIPGADPEKCLNKSGKEIDSIDFFA